MQVTEVYTQLTQQKKTKLTQGLGVFTVKATMPLFTVLLGRFLLGERQTTKVREAVTLLLPIVLCYSNIYELFSGPTMPFILILALHHPMKNCFASRPLVCIQTLHLLLAYINFMAFILQM